MSVEEDIGEKETCTRLCSSSKEVKGWRDESCCWARGSAISTTLSMDRQIEITCGNDKREVGGKGRGKRKAKEEIAMVVQKEALKYESRARDNLAWGCAT